MKWWAFAPANKDGFHVNIVGFEKKFGYRPADAMVPLDLFNALSGSEVKKVTDAKAFEYEGITIVPEPHGFGEIGFFRLREGN